MGLLDIFKSPKSKDVMQQMPFLEKWKMKLRKCKKSVLIGINRLKLFVQGEAELMILKK